MLAHSLTEPSGDALDIAADLVEPSEQRRGGHGGLWACCWIRVQGLGFRVSGLGLLGLTQTPPN